MESDSSVYYVIMGILLLIAVIVGIWFVFSSFTPKPEINQSSDYKIQVNQTTQNQTVSKKAIDQYGMMKAQSIQSGHLNISPL
jgi:preprotein translocase subunit SecF